jgi:hypothetical protein
MGGGETLAIGLLLVFLWIPFALASATVVGVKWIGGKYDSR